MGVSAQTDLEIAMLRSCVFTAQATARDMIVAGRQMEIDEIGKIIDAVAHRCLKTSEVGPGD